MTKRALVIRTAGDPALAGAIVDGLTVNLMSDPETERKAAQYDIMHGRDSRYWARRVRKARRVYRFKRPARLAGLWAGLWVLIYRAFGGDVD